MITVIAARSRNNVIGSNNSIPWHIPEDLKRFKKITENNIVIMGRKTFESIGKPLPNRKNFVITRNRNFSHEDVNVFHSLEDAIEIALMVGTGEVFIIGGGEIYKKALIDNDFVDRVELTLVNTVADGDSFFPNLNPEVWEVTKETVHSASVDGQLEYAYLRYERANPDNYKPLLYLPAARSQKQVEHMQQILNDGICPFCPNWISWYHEGEIELNGHHWIVTRNYNPYSGTKLDLLIIPKSHVENFDELNNRAQNEFSEILVEIIRHFGLEYGAIGMRFGDMTRTGGSVRHLHAHLKVGDVDNPNHEPIKFKMSSIPQINKAPTLNE
ncbi:MAG: dihydrofolate reductase [Candidatus Saccharibacteria bacterium]